MLENLRKLESPTSSLQNILISLGLIISAMWAFYTFVIQENKVNKFSPDVYIEHEVLTIKKSKKVYLETFLVVKNTSIQDLHFTLEQATADLHYNEISIKLTANPVNNEIIIHPGQLMKLPYIFPIKKEGIYLVSVRLPLDERHEKYLKDIGKSSKEIENYYFSASKYVYAGI